jgi:type I restriction enzyme M protein
MTSAEGVKKLWNYCNVLRDDGMSYGDYVEQLTYLLFLKMADERTKPPRFDKALRCWPLEDDHDVSILLDRYHTDVKIT